LASVAWISMQKHKKYSTTTKKDKMTPPKINNPKLHNHGINFSEVDKIPKNPKE
jgi:hypothetical protein